MQDGWRERWVLAYFGLAVCSLNIFCSRRTINKVYCEIVKYQYEFKGCNSHFFISYLYISQRFYITFQIICSESEKILFGKLSCVFRGIVCSYEYFCQFLQRLTNAVHKASVLIDTKIQNMPEIRKHPALKYRSMSGKTWLFMKKKKKKK